MSGEMTLWEYGAIVHECNARQPKDGPQGQGDAAFVPDIEDFREAMTRTDERVAAMEAAKNGRS